MTSTGRPAAVWTLRTPWTLEEADLHLATLEARGLLDTAAPTVSESGGAATLWLPPGSDLRGRPELGLEGSWERVPADGWDERWRASIEPVIVGPFVLTPPWRARGADDEIVIEPAQAFGTGHHETTTGCLLALVEHGVAERSVLDVGTGTGILAIAAARLGAAAVVGCDTDAVAVRTAAENAQVNGVSLTTVEGSVGDLGTADFDVVVANLDTNTVVALADELVARTRGALIVSGVSNERVAEAVDALSGAGCTPSVRRGREWALLVGGPA